MRRLSLAALVVGTLMLAGCGGDIGPPSAPTTVDGAELFEARALGATPGCVTCHSLTPEHTLVGPSLGDLASRHSELDGEGLAEHIRTSIVDPEGDASKRWSTSMPDEYAELLSDAQVEAVVDYLLEVSS